MTGSQGALRQQKLRDYSNTYAAIARYTRLPKTLVYGTITNHIILRGHKLCSKGSSRHTAFALSSERSHSCHLF
jgi:hypothetical protein